MKKILFCALAGIAIFASCKKNSVSPASTTTTTPAENADFLTSHMAGVPTSGTANQKALDTLYLAALNVYKWNTSLPTYTDFNPRQYVNNDAYTSYFNELFAITKIPINPITGLSYEYTDGTHPKYSYLNLKSTGTLASVNTESIVGDDGQGNDYGFLVGFKTDGKSASSFTDTVRNSLGITTGYIPYFRLSLIYPGSPSAAQNLVRGLKVMKVNDRAFTAMTNAELNNFVNYGNTDPSLTTVKLELQDDKNNNAVSTVTINKTKYTSSPVIKYNTFKVGTKSVGYLAYMSFQDINKTQADIDKAFASFESSDVNMENLILDFRYNGGGFVSAATYMMNKIAGNQFSGSVLFKQIYNDAMQNHQATFLKNFTGIDSKTGKTFNYYNDGDYSAANMITRFAKEGNLSKIKNVYFLVSENTASASELVYNSLKPYVNCILIGTTTYGKPVGFFPLTIGGYNVYMAMTEAKNSKDEGGYFNGITPNYTLYDDIKYDFGNANDMYTKRALDLISGLTFPKTAVRNASGMPAKPDGPIISIDRVPKGGMIISPSDLMKN